MNYSFGKNVNNSLGIKYDNNCYRQYERCPFPLQKLFMPSNTWPHDCSKLLCILFSSSPRSGQPLMHVKTITNNKFKRTTSQ